MGLKSLVLQLVKDEPNLSQEALYYSFIIIIFFFQKASLHQLVHMASTWMWIVTSIVTSHAHCTAREGRR